MRSRKFSRSALGIIVLIVFLLSPSYYVIQVRASEPSLIAIFNYFGFTNVTETTVETFSAGTYNITLYAEFAGYSDENELSYYDVNTSIFNVIFTGPEGGSGYLSPPINKTFTADFQFGLSMLSPGPHRYFTEFSRNPDGEQHAEVYENLDDPNMLLIGFENQYGAGDRDYNDMVFSLECTHELTVSAGVGGSTVPVPGVYTHPCDSSVLVEAVPDACYVFDNWELDGGNVGSVNPYSVLMDDDHSLHAVFAQIDYNLTITATAGGTTDPIPGVYSYPCGSSVSVEAVPDSCYVFDHWELDTVDVGSANPYSVLMDDDHVLHAVFSQITYQLTITATSGGTTDPVPGAYSYACGSSVQVEAIPDSCYVFDHWELDSVNVGSTTPYSVLMDDDHALHAVFIQITYQLTVTATSGGSTVPVPGVYSYPCGSSVQVEAIPDACYVFDHWELDTVDVGSVNPYSVLMDDDHALHAVFAYSPPSLSVSISPPSASVVIGNSVSFTSTLSGDAPPYSYQWYLDDAPVSGATSSSWTFTPTSTGIYYVYVKVTDACDSTAQSETAKITVRPPYVPVGGYSVSLTKSFAKAPLICYTMLLAIFGVAICLIRRKRK